VLQEGGCPDRHRNSTTIRAIPANAAIVLHELGHFRIGDQKADGLPAWPEEVLASEWALETAKRLDLGYRRDIAFQLSQKPMTYLRSALKSGEATLVEIDRTVPDELRVFFTNIGLSRLGPLRSQLGLEGFYASLPQGSGLGRSRTTVPCQQTAPRRLMAYS
jgi:hypothetical protein